MAFLSTKRHGILDYIIGGCLVFGTYVLELGSGTAQSWVPLIIGFSIITYSLFTKYEAGLFKVMHMRRHLLLDMFAGLILVASPWLFGFADEGWGFHVAAGLLILSVVFWSDAFRYRKKHKHPGLEEQHTGEPDFH